MRELGNPPSPALLFPSQLTPLPSLPPSLCPRYARDLAADRLSSLTSAAVASQLRSSVDLLRSALTRLRTRARVGRYEEGAEVMELEVLRLTLRRNQLKMAVSGAAWE